MSSTFKFHSQINETVPWNAQYSFPTQGTKAAKQTVKLPPKNGGTFSPGTIVRIEFPADNYLNALNSVLSMDLTISNGTNLTRLQRTGGHSLIKRLRVMYGSLVIEDIQEYKTLVRIFTEAGVQQDYMTSSGSILDGMYDTMELTPAGILSAPAQGGAGVLDSTTSVTLRDTLLNVVRPAGIAGQELSAAPTRTYCLNLMSGLLTSKKLIPLKWMASQLSIEITLATVADAFIASTAPTSYSLSNINFIAEMIEFDSAYDMSFFRGLETDGVPLKFSSWHFHTFTMAASTSVLQIHERSRSVKALFAVVRSNDTESTLVDSDHFFHNGAATYNGGTGALTTPANSGIEEFQTRVGGRYYPAQPVRCTNGGAEAYVELQKTLDSLGDYTRASNINYTNWTQYPLPGTVIPSALPAVDGGRFIIAQEFETTDVMPDTIAGINAEEQSDIALSIKHTGTAVNGKKVDVFMHYDSLIIVKGGNVVNLVM